MLACERISHIAVDGCATSILRKPSTLSTGTNREGHASSDTRRKLTTLLSSLTLAKPGGDRARGHIFTRLKTFKKKKFSWKS